MARRSLLFGVAFLLVPLLLSVASAAAPPPSPQPWVVTIPAAVGLGNPLVIGVTGPENATFHVGLYAQPFNSSMPISNYTFRTSPSANLSANGTVNVTLPTSFLDLGEYQVRFSNLSGILFDTSYLAVNYPVNVTQLQQNVSTLQQELQTIEDQFRGLSVRFESLQQQEQDAVWVFAGGAIFFVLYGPISIYLSKNPGWWRRRKENIVKKFWDYGLVRFAVHGSPPLPTVYDADRVFQSGYCGDCRETVATVAEIERHLTQAHGIETPRAGRDYWPSKQALAAIATYRNEELPTGRAKAQIENAYVATELLDPR